MSSELYSVSGPGGNNASLQGTTVGGSKPLHRFIKGQPKIIGIIVLVLGTAFFIVSVAIREKEITDQHIWTVIPPGILLGTLYILCGILYILTEHNPTKKTVTMSLALSIVTILGTFWTIIHILPYIVHSSYNRHYDYPEDNMTDTEEAAWASHIENMAVTVVTVESILVFYSFVGAIIFIVMSTLAGAALRSTKSQAILVMSTTPTEMPAE